MPVVLNSSDKIINFFQDYASENAIKFVEIPNATLFIKKILGVYLGVFGDAFNSCDLSSLCHKGVGCNASCSILGSRKLEIITQVISDDDYRISAGLRNGSCGSLLSVHLKDLPWLGYSYLAGSNFKDFMFLISKGKSPGISLNSYNFLSKQGSFEHLTEDNAIASVKSSLLDMYSQLDLDKLPVPNTLTNSAPDILASLPAGDKASKTAVPSKQPEDKTAQTKGNAGDKASKVTEPSKQPEDKTAQTKGNVDDKTSKTPKPSKQPDDKTAQTKGNAGEDTTENAESGKRSDNTSQTGWLLGGLLTGIGVIGGGLGLYAKHKSRQRESQKINDHNPKKLKINYLKPESN